MSSKRVFRFAYHASQRGDLRFRIHQLRDGDAFLELLPLLNKKKYKFERLLLNPPSDLPEDAREVDISFLTSSDLLVLTTRPPIHDIDDEIKRPIRCSYTNLEKLIFDALHPNYLKHCSRERIELSEPLAQQLNAGFKQKADIIFHSAVDSSYVRYRGLEERFWQRPPATEKRTAVYLIQVPAICPDGPGLLAVFGMAGTETLIWNYLLRTRFPEWLDSYQLLIAEMLLRDIPEKAVDLSFADDWEVTPMVAIPFSSRTHASF
jgi:hypothetical protein